MHGEFRPEYRPLWIFNAGNGKWEPNVDSTTGLQKVKAVATQHYLNWPGDETISAITKRSWFSLACGWGGAKGHIWFMATQNNAASGDPLTTPNGVPVYQFEYDFVLKNNVPLSFGQLPAGCSQIGIQLEAHDSPVSWAWEKEGK